ncbi:nucleotide-diphospho-sugar transferase [Penicillium waksmanii]|uniref:nucleotide-diphospho-sugar transferase n=1 Tax=Penicillium waksmanii TaxID=69791 RepID=UPI002547DD84|nr:nucleotide-diphospho-sugar transferase [Penicillium waksmanii]KAJ5975968.1 nucleotide-diphospho-sugar transferase [Penicillium waksmanii]
MIGGTAGSIVELPQDRQIVSGQRHRNFLYNVARSAETIGYVYIIIRLVSLLSTSEKTWQMWTLFLLETFFIHLARKEQSLTVLATKNPESLPRKRLRLHGNKDLPHVDVLLPCCGEDVDVILQTVQAACTLDYPKSHFRVLVLDDGQSQLLEKTVLELQTQWPHLSYNSRGRQSGQVFAKSGNLNYALTSLQRDFQPEFCAILDADSIPTREFLRATLPHLLMDPEAALVSTRQYFYNLPNGDPLSQSRGHFYTCQNAKLDTLGIAIDSGSGAVFRRQSIVDAGLYPTYSFSEDWQLSLLLRGMGYKTFQVDEALQFGQVPASLAGHIAQRKRWNIGHAQQIVAMISPRGMSLSSQLRFSIARNGFGIVFEEIGCLLGFAAVPLLLFCGKKLVPTSSPNMVALQFILSLGQFLQAAYTGHQSTPFAFLENKWLAGSNVHAILRFYFVSKKPKGSFITGSSENSFNHKTELSLCMRLYRDLWGNGIFYSVILLTVILSSIIYSSISATGKAEDFFMHTITTIAWPQLAHMCFLVLKNLSVPMIYLLDPPKYTARAIPFADMGTSQLKTEEDVVDGEAVQGTWNGIDKAGKN